MPRLPSFSNNGSVESILPVCRDAACASARDRRRGDREAAGLCWDRRRRPPPYTALSPQKSAMAKDGAISAYNPAYRCDLDIVGTDGSILPGIYGAAPPVRDDAMDVQSQLRMRRTCSNAVASSMMMQREAATQLQRRKGGSTSLVSHPDRRGVGFGDDIHAAEDDARRRPPQAIRPRRKGSQTTR